MRILTHSIDLRDCSLDGAAEHLRDEVNAFLERVHSQLLRPHERVDGFDIHPLRTSYSVPDPDRFDRDYHYSESGFILVVKIIDQPR